MSLLRGAVAPHRPGCGRGAGRRAGDLASGANHPPKYACRSCESAIVQAPAKRRLFDGGMATTAMVAKVVVWKYAWYAPLHRQAQIFAGQGVYLDRSTLAQRVKRVA